MVRFARAKGSKASNERLPEEATSWQEIKQQMIEARQPKNEKVFDVREILEDDTTVESTWATFEDNKPKKHKKKRLHDEVETEEKQIPTKNTKKKKKQQKIEPEPLVDVEVKLDNKCGDITLTSDSDANNEKKKMKSPKSIQSMVSEECREHLNNKDKNVPVGQLEDTRNIQKGAKVFVPKNTRKRKKGLSFTSKKPFENIMRIGQREVELAKFDGFPVKKEDWVRLKDLEKKMRDKNIPEAEIKSALKLERRRAEKALTRERKKVCFHCREPGHMLSNCPSIDESGFQMGRDSFPDTANSGICFKCGSTEHTHLQCRVVKGDKFRFATCFVCKEQGHISRQCPHNQNGLYPKGGACNICGEVTHLKKDCPKLREEDQNAALTLPTLTDSGGLDDLDDDSGKTVPRTSKKNSKKVVKF